MQVKVRTRKSLDILDLLLIAFSSSLACSSSPTGRQLKRWTQQTRG